MSNLDKYKRYADFGVEDFMQDPFYQDSIIRVRKNRLFFGKVSSLLTPLSWQRWREPVGF